MTQNLSMVKGDSASFALEMESYEFDLSHAFFTCRNGLYGEQIFQKSLGNGIVKEADGLYTVIIAPYDTENVEAGEYYYDFEISYNGDVWTILKGILDIEQDVTYAE